MSDQDDKDDIALFREQVANVRRLSHPGRVAVAKRPAPIARNTLADEARVVQDSLSDDFDPADFETGDELLFARPGLQHGVLRKLRRGQFSVGAALDLHGMTVPVARIALQEFLHDSRARNVRCVRIIHGKGLGSKHRGPVLKGKVNRWLSQRDEVLAFCSARRSDGGTGAVYVLLKRG
jgi:DNA-nicking Smr family endonuclease